VGVSGEGRRARSDRSPRYNPASGAALTLNGPRSWPHERAAASFDLQDEYRSRGRPIISSFH
jgi:hypothetical protein